MGKSKNHDALINLLLNKSDFTTSDTLAKKLNTSTKTIYRWVKQINREGLDEPIILSESGRGYKLNYEQYLRIHSASKRKQFSPEQRRWKMMQTLLLQAPKPVSFYDLMSEFFISESVLILDEKAIDLKLAKYGLRLCRKKRFLSVLGDEIKIRTAISDGIQQSQVIDLVELSDNADIDQEDAAFIMLQIETIENSFGITIPYPYNINIFLHLYILLERSKKTSATLELTQTIADDEIDEELYEIAKNTISEVSSYLGQDIDVNEISYLCHYLSASRMTKNKPAKQVFSDIVMNVTEAYLINMSKFLGFAIDDNIICYELANHIEPMLKRLERGIIVTNGLLEQIQMIYPDLFKYVSKSSDKITKQFNFKAISDDENGFITLYFAKLMESAATKIKTVVVCSSGIGLSELLKVKIRNSFNEIEIVDVLSTKNLKSFKLDSIDLVISTLVNAKIEKTHFLLISGMFTEEDKENLRRKIGEIKFEKINQGILS